MGLLDKGLRDGTVMNDTERTVARWLLDSDGDFDATAKASGIPAEKIKNWVKTLSPRSELRQFNS